MSAFRKAGDPSHSRSDIQVLSAALWTTLAPLCGLRCCTNERILNFSTVRLNIASFSFVISARSTVDVLTPGFHRVAKQNVPFEFCLVFSSENSEVVTFPAL